MLVLINYTDLSYSEHFVDNFSASANPCFRSVWVGLDDRAFFRMND